MTVKFPAEIDEYLRAELVGERVACVRLDETDCFISAHGAQSVFDFSALSTGESLLDRIPFLADYPAKELTVLPMMQLPACPVCDVHMRPSAAGRDVILIDVTTMHDTVHKLQQSSNELDIAIRRQDRLVNDLIEAKTQLEEQRTQIIAQDKAKGSFIAGMSHEFRTPLNSITGFTELLLNGSDLSETHAHHVETIQRGANQLLAMVDSLLDKAQLDSSEVNLRRQAVEVRRLIEEVVAMFAPFAGEKALAFSASVSLDTPKMILGDELRLRQILVNLISNAIKYTDDGGVSVAISWENGELIVVVEDTGIGIPEQDQAKIFDAFHRVSNDTDVRGAGLGLSIVAQLVTRMQGTIGCESKSGQGSRFEFRAPARKLSSDADRADGAKPRIIVVEDDQDLLSLMRIHLGRLPVDLYCASNGRDAVKLGKKLKPDLMILDMRLPILDGFEVAQQMTALSPETILVGLSGNHQQSAIDKAMLAGCSIYLSKPVRMPELIEAVNSVLVLD